MLGGMDDRHPMWKRLFSGEGFDWSFRMRPGDGREFFARTAEGDRIREHKEARIGNGPSDYVGVISEGAGLVEVLGRQFASWGLVRELSDEAYDLRSLCLEVEPDVLLCDRESLRLVAAGVCMPSSWSLEHALGMSVHAIHDSVPRLNPRIGEQIDRFLRNIPEGKSFCRANWSITRTDDLDYHPDLKRPRPDGESRLEDLFLRLEHQLFTTIPGGILMGIRIEPVPFPVIREDEQAWSGLAGTIRTMPDDVASYKGMLGYRSSLAEKMVSV